MLPAVVVILAPRLKVPPLDTSITSLPAVISAPDAMLITPVAAEFKVTEAPAVILASFATEIAPVPVVNNATLAPLPAEMALLMATVEPVNALILI